MGISFATDIKTIRDDGNFKVVTFQASRKHQPLELVFSGPNSDINRRRRLAGRRSRGSQNQGISE